MFQKYFLLGPVENPNQTTKFVTNVIKINKHWPHTVKSIILLSINSAVQCLIIILQYLKYWLVISFVKNYECAKYEVTTNLGQFFVF